VGEQLVIAPVSIPQEQMLASDSTITMISSGAGSGKTYGLLLVALKFMNVPRSTGVVFRRTSKMLDAAGSIWSEAVTLFSSVFPVGLKIRHREHEIVFPNKSVLRFSHMQYESNALDHKGRLVPL